MKLPNIVVRILAGAVFVAVLLGGILYNSYTFAVVFGIITFLGLYEFYGLIRRNADTSVPQIFASVTGTVLFYAAYRYFSDGGVFLLAVYTLLIMSIFVSELYMKRKDPIKSLSYTIFGQIYIAVPFSLVNLLGFSHSSGGYHYLYILAVLIFIWVNDSFAYLTGMAIGKHKMFERISPKKTWEGFAGGAVFAMASSLAFYHFFGELPAVAWMGLALVVVVSGTWGDLIESMMKRRLGVKDSGNVIPGHGGILDRFDSTIFSVPAVVVYLTLISYLL